MARRYVAVAERAVVGRVGAGGVAQARRLEGPSGVEAMVRDALAVMPEVPGGWVGRSPGRRGLDARR
jgi:hypothetical protein